MFSISLFLLFSPSHFRLFQFAIIWDQVYYICPLWAWHHNFPQITPSPSAPYAPSESNIPNISKILWATFFWMMSVYSLFFRSASCWLFWCDTIWYHHLVPTLSYIPYFRMIPSLYTNNIKPYYIICTKWKHDIQLIKISRCRFLRCTLLVNFFIVVSSLNAVKIPLFSNNLLGLFVSHLIVVFVWQPTLLAFCTTLARISL